MHIANVDIFIHVPDSLSIRWTSNRSFAWDPRGMLRLLLLLLVPERTAPLFEHLVEVVFEPSDVGAEPGKLPLPVHLLVPVLVEAVRVSLDRHLGPCLVSVSLVRHAELVVARHLVVARPLPSGATDEVLCLQERVSEHRGAGGHGDKLLGRHGLPGLVEE